MSKIDKVVAFIEGYATGIDMMTSNTDLKPNEYQKGYRHAMDSMLGFIDEMKAEEIESKL